MSDKPDHLIERAAALLRAASSGMSDRAGLDPAPVAPRPVARQNGAGAAGVPPIYVPPIRPTPAVDGPVPVSPQPMRPRVGSSRGVVAAAISSVVQISRFTHPPITIETLERAGLMVARLKRTRISEEYRIVIGRVLRALHDEPEGEPRREPVANNTLLVTSARPGEGKSFSALNLAGSIAQNAEESVLLVDVDAKVRPISQQLGIEDSPGFMDMIAEPSLSPEDLVHPTELPNLFVMSLGTHVVRRGATSNDGFGTDVRSITPALHRVAKRFPKTLIVLDAPPCLSTSDPHTLAPHVGQVVLVVEAERTQRSEVEAALDLIRVCPTITMLLNKVRLSTNHTFGAYDYFGSYT